MYGTIAKMRLKPGMEAQMQELMKEYDGVNIPGHVSFNVYRMDADANEYYLAVVFEDRESYHANAQNPEQDQRFQKMAALLDGEPEWHDGEIIATG